MINELLTRWLWIGQPIDALALEAPVHDGSPRELGREIYHRLLARLIAERAYRMQGYIMFAALLIAFIATGGSLIWHTAASFNIPGQFVLFLIGFIGTLSAAPVLMKTIPTKSLAKEAAGVIRRCFLRDIPDDAPSDLADMWRHGWLTSEGRPLSSEITENDAASLAAQQRTYWWIIAAIAAGLALAGLVGMPSVVLLIAGLILYKWFADTSPIRERALELQTLAGIEGAAFVSAGGPAWATIPETARQRQIQEAMRDKSPVATLGTSTGLLAARGDFYAPSRDMPFCLSLADLHQHLLVTGGTGSGKTSGVLRPLARQVAQWDDVGLVIMDGKGSLPLELADLPGMKIIDPAREIISMIAGLDPHLVADTIAEMLGASDERFWRDSAGGLLRRAAILAEAAGPEWWNLVNIRRIALEDGFRRKAVDQINKNLADGRIRESAMLMEAATFFGETWPNMSSRLRSNIETTMQTWIYTLTGHPDLFRWAETLKEHESMDILTPLRGGRRGLLLPAYRYGDAGAVVTALLKARFYQQIKRRAETGLAEGETPVLFIIDEAQEAATAEDAAMLPIGRSLGLAYVAATQTVEGVADKLERGTEKWLGIFGGLISLPGRSPQTDEFTARRAGASWRPVIAGAGGLPTRDAIQAGAATGAFAAGRHQPTILEGASSFPGQALKKAAEFIKQATGSAGITVTSKTQAQFGIHPVITGPEISTLLAEPDTALALVTRARVLRRDVIRLSPVYPEKTAGGQQEKEKTGEQEKPESAPGGKTGHGLGDWDLV